MKTANDLSQLKSWENPPPIELSAFKKALRKAWKEKFGNRCQSCGCFMHFEPRFSVHRHYATIDHIKARSCGGDNSLKNLQVICKKCNTIKSERESQEAGVFEQDMRNRDRERKMKKIILFNGPPGSGKDTAAALARTWIKAQGMKSGLYRFARPLKRAVHEMFGLGVIDEEYFSDSKDAPLEIFFGMTPRQVYIEFSQQFAKVYFGQDFWCKVAIQALKTPEFSNTDVILIPDLGFQDEIEEIVSAFGDGKILTVQMYRDGHSFVNDSRYYVQQDDRSRFEALNNDGDKSALATKVNAILEQFIKGEKI